MPGIIAGRNWGPGRPGGYRSWYDRGEIQALLNFGGRTWPLAGEGEVLFARKQCETVLRPGGIGIRRMKYA